MKNVKYIFFDIDHTISRSLFGYNRIGYFEYVLAGLLCKEQNMSPAEAIELTVEKENCFPGADPFKAATELGIPLRQYQQELEAVQQKYLEVYEDAIELIAALKAQKYELFITSNNDQSRARAVLVGAGLADWNGHKYFTDTFGPDFTGCLKNSPEFFRKVITEGGFDAERVLIIGDDLNCDRKIPAMAGINNSILIDRNGALEGNRVVTDLRGVLDVLEK